jgi:hypothetical protein
MSITLDLSAELESELKEEAARHGMSLEEYAVQLLTLIPGLPSKEAPKTGAELVEYWRREGVFGMRPDIQDSQKHARMIREKAERRIRE